MDTKKRIVVGAVAAVFLAGFGLAGLRAARGRSGAKAPPATAPETAQPPAADAKPRPELFNPEAQLKVTLFTQTCAGADCSEPVRIAGKVSVRDKAGEITAPKLAGSGEPVAIPMPWGEYDLVGIDDEGNQSPPQHLKLKGGTTTETSLIIVKAK